TAGETLTAGGFKLAQDRAEKVRDYFVEEGKIDPSRITASGEGGINSDSADYDPNNRKVAIEYKYR
ncbi:MAG: OmpA family protein, partial [Clostridiales bacterium]|nr:OmpA family protein [Clostridiales bacterium]